MYYFGEGTDLTTGLGNVHEHVSSTLVGLEGGYNIGISMLTIRPQLGLGYYSAGATVTFPQGIGATASGSSNSSSIYLEPGVTGLISLGMWFVGADVGVLWVPAVDDEQAAVVVHGQVGIKL
jgi:hypothetical protein